MNLYRKESIRRLGAAGLVHEINLPMVNAEKGAMVAPLAEQVACRAICVYLVTGLANGADGESMLAWAVDNNIGGCLTKYEKECLEAGDHLAEKDLVNLSWGRECLYMLAWCLGLVERPPYPSVDGEANLEVLFKRMPPVVNVSEFIKGASLKSREDVLFELDYYYCLHWYARHYQVGLSSSLIRERRRALEWVVGVQVDFDNIVLDT